MPGNKKPTRSRVQPGGGSGGGGQTHLLVAQVQRLVLLALVVLGEGLTLDLVHDGEHARDRLANNLDLRELGGGATSDLGDPELREL